MVAENGLDAARTVQDYFAMLSDVMEVATEMDD